MGLDGSCYNCDDNDKYPANANACNACNGAGLVNRRKMVGNNCARESCPTGYFQGSEGACIPCGSTLSFSADSTECAKCADSGTPRIMDNNNKCVPHDSSCAEGFISEQICHSCDADATVKADAAECGKCTNRYRDSSGWCLLSGTCPVNQFWSLTYDKCISCSEIIWTGSTTTGRHKATKSECDKCGTSRVEVEISGSTDVWCDAVCPYGYFRNKNRNCTDCAMNAGKETSEEECNKCKDTGWPRTMSGKNCVSDAACKAGTFPDLNGTCQSCANAGPTDTTEEACARCDKPYGTNNNIVSAREWVNGKCRAPTCPSGKFMAKDGSCKLCTWSSWNEIDKQGVQSFEVEDLSECDVCGDLRKKVTRSGKYYCDPVCPWGQFQNTNGNCTGCWRYLSGGKATSKEQCDLCKVFATQYADHGLTEQPNWDHIYKSDGKCEKTEKKDDPKF